MTVCCFFLCLCPCPPALSPVPCPLSAVPCPLSHVSPCCPPCRHDLSIADINEAFTKHDADSRGYIARADFVLVLDQLHVLLPNELVQQLADMLSNRAGDVACVVVVVAFPLLISVLLLLLLLHFFFPSLSVRWVCRWYRGVRACECACACVCVRGTTGGRVGGWVGCLPVRLGRAIARNRP
jgi:hypothetical protein